VEVEGEPCSHARVFEVDPSSWRDANLNEIVCGSDNDVSKDKRALAEVRLPAVGALSECEEGTLRGDVLHHEQLCPPFNPVNIDTSTKERFRVLPTSCGDRPRPADLQARRVLPVRLCGQPVKNLRRMAQLPDKPVLDRPPPDRQHGARKKILDLHRVVHDQEACIVTKPEKVDVGFFLRLRRIELKKGLLGTCRFAPHSAVPVMINAIRTGHLLTRNDGNGQRRGEHGLAKRDPRPTGGKGATPTAARAADLSHGLGTDSDRQPAPSDLRGVELSVVTAAASNRHRACNRHGSLDRRELVTDSKKMKEGAELRHCSRAQ